MPIYEYKCNKEKGGCGYTFEEIQAFKEPIKKKCPECGGNFLEKIFGKPTFIFKGTGFYATDYKDK